MESAAQPLVALAFSKKAEIRSTQTKNCFDWISAYSIFNEKHMLKKETFQVKSFGGGVCGGLCAVGARLGGRASGAGSFERGSRGRVGGRPPAPPGQHTQVRNRARARGQKGGMAGEEGCLGVRC